MPSRYQLPLRATTYMESFGRLTVAAFCSIWLLTGCASHRTAAVDNPKANSAELKLPRETSINPDAGRGNLLLVNVQLTDGKKRCFVLDTGAGITCVDESLVSELGSSVGTVTAHHWGKDTSKKLYAMPAMYLGGARLRSGKMVMAMDFKGLSMTCGQPIAGVLGMDVLENYCVQIDFAANRLRFLDESQADKSAWGRAFPLIPLNDKDPRPAVAGNLFGEESPHSLVDSGYDGAGWLMAKRYEQWTNQTATISPAMARSPDGRFFGELYPDLKLDRQDVESDGIGAAFLARHLVTLDFPQRTLYLKRTSTGPLPDMGGAPVTFLKNLKERGQLPGWSKDEHGAPKRVKQNAGTDTVVVEVEKNGDSSIYHYQVTRTAADAPWSLARAWRTDAKDRVLEDYPVSKESRP
jgi:hypothetical protein